jgi:hypothetical protein
MNKKYSYCKPKGNFWDERGELPGSEMEKMNFSSRAFHFSATWTCGTPLADATLIYLP